MIVIDSSALVAIAQMEPERDAFLRVLDQEDTAFISPINYAEAAIILVGRGLFSGSDDFGDWLAGVGVVVREEPGLGAAALAAYLRYGKGWDSVRLNLADVFAYALAKQLDLPLLYKGDDFTKTDIRSAL